MIYVFLANGFEEIEALAPVDVIRRAGIPVQTVGIGGRVVFGSHNIPVTADIDDKQVRLDENLQAIVLPGGMPGAQNLEDSAVVQMAIDYCMEKNILVAAICAAPFILAHKGLLKGKKATAFPEYQKEIEKAGAVLSQEFVCCDENIITARGMGVSLEFGLEIVKVLTTDKTAQNIREKIQCQ